MSLEGKTAAITGAGSGFGRATARLFAKRGADVVAVDIDEARVDETVTQIEDQNRPGEAVAVTADVTDSEQVAAFVEATVETFGGLDVLHNNAGVLHSRTSVTELSEDEWDRIHGVNLKGAFLGAKHAVPHMREQGGGAIVNTASISGHRPRTGLSAYASSKGGVITLTKELALELAEDDIRVNSVSPVAARTSMLSAFSEDDLEELAETIPLGRMADPTDIAQAVAFLADDDAAGLITGVDLPVDGGRGI